MPTVAEKIIIPSPPDEVWPLLSDPALVASCIPGAQLAPDQDGGDVWKGSIRVKFGPTVAMFRGEATLSYDHDNKRCTIEGRGIDGRGASRALAHGVVAAKGTTETELSVEGEYSVTGPLETFANAGGVHVARALLAEFAKNLGALIVEQKGGGAQPAAASAPDVAAPAPAAAAVAAAAAAVPGSTQPAVAAGGAPHTAKPETQARGTTGPAYVITSMRIRDAAALDEYRRLASPVVAAHGGKAIVRGGAPRAIEGETPDAVTVLEFPSRGAAEAFFASPDYAKARALGERAFSRSVLLVDGLVVERAASPAPLATPIRPRAAAAELNATTLMWAAFKSWLSSLFTKRS